LALRLCLLTGARVGEISGLSRSELINIDTPASAALSIPRDRIKNGRDFIIPLAPTARATVLELLDMIEPGEQYLFPTRSKRRIGPVRPNTLTQAMANFGAGLARRESVQLAAMPLANDPACTWATDTPSPHDLRRSVETRLAGLGIAKEYRDAVLNHANSDVGSKHYNKYDYLAEKRSALTRWNDALGAILDMSADGATIHTLPARSAR
jgi:integrase